MISWCLSQQRGALWDLMLVCSEQRQKQIKEQKVVTQEYIQMYPWGMSQFVHTSHPNFHLDLNPFKGFVHFMIHHPHPYPKLKKTTIPWLRKDFSTLSNKYFFIYLKVNSLCVVWICPFQQSNWTHQERQITVAWKPLIWLTSKLLRAYASSPPPAGWPSTESSEAVAWAALEMPDTACCSCL